MVKKMIFNTLDTVDLALDKIKEKFNMSSLGIPEDILGKYALFKPPKTQDDVGTYLMDKDATLFSCLLCDHVCVSCYVMACPSVFMPSLMILPRARHVWLMHAYSRS